MSLTDGVRTVDYGEKGKVVFQKKMGQYFPSKICPFWKGGKEHWNSKTSRRKMA